MLFYHPRVRSVVAEFNEQNRLPIFIPCVIVLTNYLLAVYMKADACAIVPELKMDADSFVDGQVSYGSVS